MKKFKQGFTLAEALITLTIIGVIAALATPTLINNVAMAKIGPALSKFYNIYTSGMKTMMQEEGETALTKGLTRNFTTLANYINMIAISDYKFVAGDKTTEQKLYFDATALNKAIGELGADATDDAKKEFAAANSIVQGYKLQNGLIMIVYPYQTEITLTDKGQYKKIYGELLIDIDGNKKQNVAGRDVFAFLIDSSGALIAASSREHVWIAQSGTKFIGATSSACSISSSDVAKNFACTGAIADNGWSTSKLDLGS